MSAITNRGSNMGEFLKMAFVVIGAVLILFPVVWMLSTSLKDLSQIFHYPPELIPHPFRWSNYRDAWNVVPFSRYLMNTVMVAGIVTIGQLVFCSLAGYAFARLDFPLKNELFLLYLGGLMMPIQVIMIPLFFMMKSFGWIDSLRALIIPNFLGGAFGTFLMRQAFLGIPKELEEAAAIDGCGKFRIYYTIFLPLSKTTLATLAVFTLMYHWNDFLWPLTIINSQDQKTLTLGLASFQGLYTTNYHLLMAAAVLSLLPIVAVFLFAQKYFVQGITMTGING